MGQENKQGEQGSEDKQGGKFDQQQPGGQSGQGVQLAQESPGFQSENAGRGARDPELIGKQDSWRPTDDAVGERQDGGSDETAA